jgi:hypothetical protein
MTERRSTLERLAPLTGLVFAAAFVVLFAIGSDSPDADARLTKVIQYWTDHKDREIASSIVASVGLLFFVWFAGCLRARLALLEGGGRRLANTAFAGAILFAVGGLLFSALNFAVADTVGKVPPGVTQSIHVLDNELFFPLLVGTALLYLASGVAILRTRALPVWLGWVSVVLGVLSVTPVGFFAFLAMILWVGLVSVLLYLRPVEAAAAPAV